MRDTYTGDTVVNAGALQLNVAGANAGALRLNNGAMVNLNFTDTTIVGAFYTNNVPFANGFYSASNLPGFITGSGLLQVGFASVSYSYVDLIGRLTNLEQLAQLPVGGETSAEWTSRDRSSVYDSATGQYLNWGADNDGGGFVSTQQDGGIGVMAEITGPGLQSGVFGQVRRGQSCGRYFLMVQTRPPWICHLRIILMARNHLSFILP